MRTRRIIIGGVIVLAAVMSTGCSAYNAAHDYNAPTPGRVVTGDWTRIETPGNFPSVVFECVGRDGVYQSMDAASSVEVVPGDPNCLPGVTLGQGRP